MTEPVPAERAPRRWWRARPESWWWIALIVLVPVIVLTGAAAWVLLATTHPTQAADQINLVKTALAVGAGTGGVITLILASRRQWHLERESTDKRITELYTKAADQLGSEKAPVRLAGLYALERLAQDNSDQRQTIVNVLCAYLRMPYTPPGPTPGGDATREARDDHRDDMQERQVRLTAQRILRDHLRPGENPARPVVTFWPAIDLDLIDATLLDFDLTHCQLATAVFDGAQFAGTAVFTGVEFAGAARFDGAQFAGDAVFAAAQFAGTAVFEEAQFADTTWFAAAQFAGTAVFTGVEFAGAARFDGAQFTGTAVFDGWDSWVRLDVPDTVTRCWPAGWAVVPTAERPDPDASGKWGRLTRSPTSPGS